MSRLADPSPVKYFLAAFGRDADLIEKAADRLGRAFHQGRLGNPDIILDRPFSETDYYEPEMGPGLIKRYLTWSNLGSPDLLPELKLQAMETEKEYARKADGRLLRQVNLDPGYISAGGLVLSTGKFSGHRLYLGNRVWGELTIHFHRGRFESLPWTYRDYQSPEIVDLLTRMRKSYLAAVGRGEAL
ncbi:MAG: DUF4416 family protein [Deltaproteobacteria bacterium]|jgi:hypothetical protein|nr:DUF4416 family protein [Deltaproteobacteria bacterium]